MKKWFLHILLLAGLFGVLTTSCSQEEGLEPQALASEEKVQVMFNIALGTTSTRSRADEDSNWGDTYDSSIGDIFDNKIDPDKFFVKLIPSEGDEKEVNPIASWHIANNEYKFVGEVKNIDAEDLTGAKVMVYANVEKEDIEALQFNTKYNDFPGKGVECIPMWGVHTITQNDIQNNIIEPTQPIYLLRAMAKIELALSAELKAKNYTIASVNLQKYNTKGNLLPSPSNDNTEEYTTDYKINAINSVHAPSDGLGFFPLDNGNYIIYVPEYQIQYDEEGKSNLEIQVLANHGNTPVSVSRNGFFNVENSLIRNHWYKYTVNKINDGYNMDVSFTVQDWTLVEESWDYTDQITISSDSHKLKFGTIKNGGFESNPVQTKEVVTNGEDLFCQFGIATPTGATWRAEFITLSGDKDDFVFITKDSSGFEVEKNAMEGKVGQVATLQIRPTKTNLSYNNQVLLRISVKTIDGRTILVKNLLPTGLGAIEYTITHSK